MPKAQYAAGAQLVFAGPAHTGYPSGANVFVTRVRADGEAWLYDVLIKIGPSDHQMVKASGLQEGRIATAKSCVPMIFGEFVRTAPKLIVPLYQRRYCWEAPQWRKLWQDVVSPRALGQHFIGRVTIARESRAIVIVDGQQRNTTLMLMLCAIRDVAVEAGAEAAASLVGKIEAVLMSRPSKKQTGHDEGVSRTALVGLEALEGAASVRFVPSRADRLPFCSLVLGVPFDRKASKAATKMSDCYNIFREEAAMLLSRQIPFASVGSSGGLSRDGAPSVDTGAEAGQAAAVEAAADEMSKIRVAQCVEALGRVVENALTRLSIVVFELQDGVALQNMYDMLAQRERALNSQFFGKNVGGHIMNEVDLVRNNLLNAIGDDDERVAAYEELWLPMEKAQGDGDAQALEQFMRKFVDEALARHAACHPKPPSAPETAESEAMPPPARKAPPASLAQKMVPLLDDVGKLLRQRGGVTGAASLFEHGTAAAETAAPVDASAATAAALGLLREMSQAAVRFGARPVLSS